MENLSVLYLDFSKAFDTVPHNRLIRKVRNFGIGGKLLKLINSYLSGHVQSVKLNNTLSSPLRVKYINDLPDSFQECFGYADDRKILFRNQDEIDEGTKKLESWCTLNNRKLNAKKCSLVVIKGELTATLQNQKITRSCLQRDLGLLVSNSLSWTENCTIRSSKSLGALFKIRRNVSAQCNTQLKIHAYTGYVMPIFTFCSQAYYPSVSSLKKLEKIQKHATVCFYGYNDNYKARLLRCNLLPASLYIELHDVLYLQMLLNGRVDIKPSALLTVNENESTRQGQRKELAANSSRKRKSEEIFVRRASILYNILSWHAQYTNVKLNKSSLTYIYCQYFVEC